MLSGFSLDSLVGQVSSGLRYKRARGRMTVVLVDSNTTGTTYVACVAELDELAHADLVNRGDFDIVANGSLGLVKMISDSRKYLNRCGHMGEDRSVSFV